MLNPFRRKRIIMPNPEDIEAYSRFDPNPAMVGMTSSGPMVVDERSGLVGTLTPRLSTFRASDGGRIYGVEFGLDGAIPFSDVEATKPKKSNFLRYAATALGIAGVGFAVASCGGSSGGGGGGGNPGPGPVLDVTPPASITDLAVVNPTGTYVEEIALKWTSPGDDGNVGEPSFFVVKYTADNPIMTEAQWNAAIDLGTVTAQGAAGTGYSQTFPVPPGIQCFAMKVYDEANNASGLSNSVCADVMSKAEDYVNTWLPIDWSNILNYNEAVAMIQGEGSIPSYVSLIAVELMKANPAYPGTQQELESDLVFLTNGNLVDSELHSGFDPFNFDNDGVGNPAVRLYFAPDGLSGWDFDNLPPDAVTNLQDIIYGFLLQYVDAHQSDYGNLDIAHNPTWTTQD